MPRHKDIDWNLPEKPQDWAQVHTAVLMDIRDRLNVLRCPDFIDIPHRLAQIEAQLKNSIENAGASA